MERYNLGRITGLSAYEVAVKNGFEGTEQEWLDNLKATDEQITTAVNGYLEENPLPVEVIDGSVTLPKLDEELKNILTTTGKNLVNPAEFVEGYAINNVSYSSGQELVATAGNTATGKIYVAGGKTYYLSLKNGTTRAVRISMHYTDGTKKFSQINVGEQGTALTTESNAEYFIASGLTELIEVLQVEVGAKTDYEPFGYRVNYSFDDNHLMQYRGKVEDYGTKFADCKEIGIYDFLYSDIKNKKFGDAPSDIKESSGGLFVYKLEGNNTVYQFIVNNQNQLYFRQGTAAFAPLLGGAEEQKSKGNWYAVGDSITQGWYSEFKTGGGSNQACNSAYGWATKLADLKGYTLRNLAIGGTGFVDPNDDDTGRTIIDANSFANADFVTIAYGVNDWKGNQPIGTMEDDLTTGGTVISNMRYMIEKILNDNPLCKIYVITPLNCSMYGTKDTNWGLGYSFETSGTLEDMFEAIVSVCEYYGIEYIDMTHNSVINRHNIETLMPDKVHPTPEAHTVIAHEISEKISWL